jgi:arginyl-tRNA synthetase
MRGDFRLYARTMPRTITDLLTAALREALGGAGLPVPPAVFWEPPRDSRHGDYATNVAMTLAREARQAARRVADAIVFPQTAAVDRSYRRTWFPNVFLSLAWCAESFVKS